MHNAPILTCISKNAYPNITWKWMPVLSCLANLKLVFWRRSSFISFLHVFGIVIPPLVTRPWPDYSLSVVDNRINSSRVFNFQLSLHVDHLFFSNNVPPWGPNSCDLVDTFSLGTHQPSKKTCVNLRIRSEKRKHILETRSYPKEWFTIRYGIRTHYLLRRFTQSNKVSMLPKVV